MILREEMPVAAATYIIANSEGAKIVWNYLQANWTQTNLPS